MHNFFTKLKDKGRNTAYQRLYNRSFQNEKIHLGLVNRSSVNFAPSDDKLKLITKTLKNNFKGSYDDFL